MRQYKIYVGSGKELGNKGLDIGDLESDKFYFAFLIPGPVDDYLHSCGPFDTENAADAGFRLLFESGTGNAN
jgi:hypothetical protein